MTIKFFKDFNRFLTIKSHLSASRTILDNNLAKIKGASQQKIESLREAFQKDIHDVKALKREMSRLNSFVVFLLCLITFQWGKHSPLQKTMIKVKDLRNAMAPTLQEPGEDSDEGSLNQGSGNQWPVHLPELLFRNDVARSIISNKDTLQKPAPLEPETVKASLRAWNIDEDNYVDTEKVIRRLETYWENYKWEYGQGLFVLTIMEAKTSGLMKLGSESLLKAAFTYFIYTGKANYMCRGQKREFILATKDFPFENLNRVLSNRINLEDIFSQMHKITALKIHETMEGGA